MNTKGYMPQEGPQTNAHASKADILLFGGAAGGGKSLFLVAEPLRHIHNSRFSGVLFRKSYPQIMLPGGLWSKTTDIYPAANGKPVKSDPKWVFPSGSEILLRHFQDDSVIDDFQGSEIPYFGFDELTHYTKEQFFNVALSRGRSTSGVKPYVRCTCNPDADSWVKLVWGPWVDEDYEGEFGKALPGEIRYFYMQDDRIIWVSEDWRDEETGLRALSMTFIPSSVYDNKILLKENPEYLMRLKGLPLVDQARLLHGDWKIRHSGNMFKEDWFELVCWEDLPPMHEIAWSRRWDLAACEVKPNKPEPDFTSSCLMGYHDKTDTYYMADMTAFQKTPGDSLDEIYEVTRIDHNTIGKNSMYGRVKFRIEQEPGSAGLYVVDQICSDPRFKPYFPDGLRSTGSKIERAKPLSRDCQKHKVKLIRGHRNSKQIASWINTVWFKFALPFPKKGVKDDPVDAASGAHLDLNEIAEYSCPIDPSERIGNINNKVKLDGREGELIKGGYNVDSLIRGNRW